MISINLAREALSSGDKILSELLTTCDHFSRILNTHELNKTNDENNVIEQFKKNIDESNSVKSEGCSKN